MLRRSMAMFVIVSVGLLLSCEEETTDFADDLIGVYILTEIVDPGIDTVDFTQFELYEAWFIEFQRHQLILHVNDYTLCEYAFESDSQEVAAYKAAVIRFSDGSQIAYSLDGDTLRLNDEGDEYTLERYEEPFPPPSWIDPEKLPNDDFEDDDDFANATDLDVGTTGQEHYLGLCGDLDWFSFAAAAGATYVMYTETPGDDYLDLVLDLYDSAMTFLDSDDDAIPFEDLNPSLTWTCSTSGTYYFAIDGFSSYDYGNYMVNLIQATGAAAAITPPDDREIRKSGMVRSRPEISIGFIH